MTVPKTTNLGISIGTPDTPSHNSARGWPDGIADAIITIDTALGGTDEPAIAEIETDILALEAAIGFTALTTDAAGAAVISQKQGQIVLAKATAGAWTLAAPTAGADDGKIMVIMAGTAHAHTVTNATPGFNSGHTVATFAAVGDSLRLLAYNGAWLTDPTGQSAVLGT
jgi:hypothetical protein